MPGVSSETVDASIQTAQVSGAAGISSKLREQEPEGALRFIAQETGGKAVINSNRTLALAEAARDTRSYYWLGFTPTWKRNDKSHRVQVEAVRPGLTVRARENFLDLSRKAEVSMKVESALLFGSLPGAVPLPLRLGTPVRTKRGELEIPVTLGLPADILTVVPFEGKYAAELELRVAATDDQGNSSEIPVIPLSLSAERLPKAGGFVKYETKLKLHGNATRLVLAVYDPVSGKIATAQTPVPVPGGS